MMDERDLRGFKYSKLIAELTESLHTCQWGSADDCRIPRTLGLKGFVEKMKEIIVSGRIDDVQAIWCRHFIAYGGDAYFKDWHS